MMEGWYANNNNRCDMCYSNETLEKRYINILKDVELRYDMNE